MGSFPIGVAFNIYSGDLYMTNRNGTAVSVIAPLTTTFSDGCNGTMDSAVRSLYVTYPTARGDN